LPIFVLLWNFSPAANIKGSVLMPSALHSFRLAQGFGVSSFTASVVPFETMRAGSCNDGCSLRGSSTAWRKLTPRLFITQSMTEPPV
jgi:hypothetical protein